VYPSVEVRWFFPGEAPPEAHAWFDALGAPVGLETRTDRYLVPASADAPGVKLREGRLEVKAPTAGPAPVRLRPGVEGWLEAFRKWSFPLGPDAEAPEAGWVDVAKARRLRRFLVTDKGLRPVPPRTPGTGCDVELGTVRLGAGVGWTVCLEASGPTDEARRAALLRVAAEVFAGDAPMLDAAHSEGYVGWLAREAG